MLRKLLAPLQNAILHRPAPVVVGSVLLALAAAVLGAMQIEFRTSRNELAPSDDPDQTRWTALMEEYGGSEALIACVEAAPGAAQDPTGLRAFADRLALEFQDDPLVENVFHRVDTDWFLERGLYLLPPDTLRSVVRALGSEGLLLDELHTLRNLSDLVDRLARRIERAGEEAGEVPVEGAQAAVGLGLLIGEFGDFLSDPSTTTDRWSALSPSAALAGDRSTAAPDGYLATHDGQTLFLIVSPRDTADDLATRRELVASMRDRADRVTRLEPDFRVAFTGQPALVVEEMNTVRRDTWITSAIAVTGVSLLTLLVFRWRTHAVLVLATLAIGIAWSFGAVWLELGYLNMITASFLSTLVGIGVAYGIHPVSEYELAGAHTREPSDTVRQAFQRTGAGVAVAAVTTSAAFFSIQLMRFRGFGELGLVAGVGVLLCFVAAGTALPAMLVLYGNWRRRRDELGRRPAVVDRVWVELAAGNICRAPLAVTVVALIVTALALWAATGLSFNTNLFDLLPRNAESLRYQHRMVMESDLSPLYSIVVAEDLASLEGMQRRAEAEPTVGHFESALSFLPRDPQVAEQALSELRIRLASVELPDVVSPLDRETLGASLGRLEEVLALAGDDAFAAGLADLAGPLEEARAEVERSRELVIAAGPALVEAWNEHQTRLLDLARSAVVDLRRYAGAEAPELDNLPAAIRERFLTRSGALLGFLHPVGNVFEPEQLEAYVAASRRVAPDVTGFPIVFHKMAGRITSGFYRAVLLGAVLVTLILLLDYRSFRDAFLALVPLALGLIWMAGAMRVLGISFNFANLVAVPLVLGVGIDNGVHVIHRVRLEGHLGAGTVLRHTGRAILIASLTTMIGFGSLVLASHRGLASLGSVLLLGVGSCLVTSMVVLPNLLVLLGIVKR